MDSYIAVIGIIVEDRNSVQRTNSLLHEYSQYTIGRLGLPYQKKNLSIISIVVDAPEDVIKSLSEKLEAVEGIRTKILNTQV